MEPTYTRHCRDCAKFEQSVSKEVGFCTNVPALRVKVCSDADICESYCPKRDEENAVSKLADFLSCVDVSPDAEPESPFTYDTVHCDCVCKGCGALLYTDVVAVRTLDDDVKDVDMRYCPLCGYPAKLQTSSMYGEQRAKHIENRYAHGPVECIDAIKSALAPEEWRGFVKGNVLKYVWREAYKGGDCDLRKAADYLARYLRKGDYGETVAAK